MTMTTKVAMKVCEVTHLFSSSNHSVLESVVNNVVNLKYNTSLSTLNIFHCCPPPPHNFVLYVNAILSQISSSIEIIQLGIGIDGTEDVDIVDWHMLAHNASQPRFTQLHAIEFLITGTGEDEKAKDIIETMLGEGDSPKIIVKCKLVHLMHFSR
jgi:hypothetical protein